MAKFYLDKFKDVSGMSFAVTKVHSPYRFGWEPIPWTKVMDDGTKVEKKGKFHSFFQFPSDVREVVHSGDKEIAERVGSSVMEWREQFWDASVNRYGFRKLNPQPNFKTETEVTEDDGKGGKRKVKWMKLYKKVFDVEVQFDKDQKFTNYKGEETVTNGAVLKHVSASHIRTMIETFTDEAEKIQKVPGKDKMGNPIMAMPFDWEDSVKDSVVGKFIKLKVTGSGLNTQYIFAPGTIFAIREEDKSFETFGEPEKKAVDDKSKFKVDESEISSIPF